MATNEETLCAFLLALVTNPLTLTLIGILIGGLITWGVSRYYYKRAGDELRQEAALLQQASNVIISFLQNQGANIQVQRDDAGRLTGLRVSAAGEASGSSTVEGRSG